jgi:hypothetical protein
MGEQPQDASVAIARRHAANEVRVRFRDDAGKDRDPET